jgi:hypothetical protein
MSNDLRSTALALTLFGNVALLATAASAVEPDTDPPAGPGLPAARTDRPDFQQDGATRDFLDPLDVGAEPSPPPRADIIEPAPLPEPMPDD